MILELNMSSEVKAVCCRTPQKRHADSPAMIRLSEHMSAVSRVYDDGEYIFLVRRGGESCGLERCVTREGMMSCYGPVRV